MVNEARNTGIAPEHARATFRDIFDSVADSFDQGDVPFFSVFGAWLAGAAGVQPGERVLDIGCGRGAVTFPVAAAAGMPGHVVAIDVAPRMVELLQREADARGIGNITALVADGQDPPGADAPFDCVVGGFVIVLMSDPLAALRRYRTLLRDGGRLALSTAGRSDERWAWLQQLTDMVPVDERPPDRSRTGPFESIESMHALLHDAGFVQAHTVEREHTVAFDDAEHWIRWSRSMGRRATWDRIPAGRSDEAVALVRRHIDELAARAGRIELRTIVRVTTAQRERG